MPTLRKHPKSPYWYVVLTREDGSRTDKSTKKRDRKEALEFAALLDKTAKAKRERTLFEGQAAKLFNEAIGIGGEKLNQDTVEEYLNKYISRVDGISTGEKYGQSVNEFLKCLGAKSKNLLSYISSNDIQAFIDARKESGVSATTILANLSPLKHAFGKALIQGIIQLNPVTKALSINKLKPDSVERFDFSEQEIAELQAVAEGEWKTMLMLGIYTGARITDCAKMHWGLIEDSKTGKILRFWVKKKKDFIPLPIHPNLWAHLESLPPHFKGDYPFCPTLSNTATDGGNGLSTQFIKLMIKVKIDPLYVQRKRKFARKSFHSLRHTTNTILAEAGVSQEIRQLILGQTSKVVNAKYTHLTMKSMATALEKIA